MTQISQEILSYFQVRKTKKQKTGFINFLLPEIRGMGYSPKVETNGIFKSRNIVVGDIKNAGIVFSAHYDTCAAMPVPNFIMPQNILFTVLYSFVLAIPVFIIAFAVSFTAAYLTSSPVVSSVSAMAVCILLIYLMLFGKANRHTANDNTSGVITLMEIMAALPHELRDNAAFVFFDHEEAGLLGSAAFRKMHRTEMENKLLVNFDCVSDGDNILFVLSKKAAHEYLEPLKLSTIAVSGKNTVFADVSNTFYPSDQMHFPLSVGVAALKRGPLGLYMDRIHTNRDTVFDFSNIEFIRGSIINFLRAI